MNVLTRTWKKTGCPGAGKEPGDSRETLEAEVSCGASCGLAE